MTKKEKIKSAFYLILLILAGVIFCFIRNAEDSLRYDEAMEYLISNTDYYRMNPLIRSTFQPPLYNYVIHIWLMISKSVMWFKIFNIVCYALCIWGLIKIMQFFYASNVMLLVAVICQSGCSGLIYYSQICGEYVLAYVLTYWMVYAALMMIRNPKWKTIICYMVLAILGIYTQYGVAFSIIGTGVVAAVVLIFRRDYKNFARLVVSGIVSGICLVLPLYFTFAKVQTANQKNDLDIIGFRSMLEGLKEALAFSMFCWHDNYQARLTGILVIALVLLSILIIYKIVRMRKEDKSVFEYEWLYIFGMIAVALIFYLPAVDSGIYAYGDYASRHTTLIMPLLLIGMVLFVFIAVKILSNNLVEKWISRGIITVTVGLFLLNAFHFNAIEHWDYDQIDNGLKVIQNSNSPVWISVYAVPTALVYSGRSEAQEEYINYYMQGITYEKAGVTYSATDDIVQDYNNQLPQECILLTFDNDDGWMQADRAFTEQGYNKQILMDPIPSRMGEGSVVVKYQLNR